MFVLAAAWAAAVSGQAPATVALVGARVIDGTGAAPIANATLLVTNGRIERIGPSASLKVPAGAARIDVAGKTIIPGLVNAHGHLGHGDVRCRYTTRSSSSSSSIRASASRPFTRSAMMEWRACG